METKLPPFTGPFPAPSDPFRVIRLAALIVVGFVCFFIGLSLGLIVGILAS